MIRTSGGEWHAVQFLRTFLSMETRLTNLYVPLHACLPQMLVKLWHKSSYGPVRQIEKGCHVIGGGGWHAIQFLRTFVSMEMNHYVTLHASLPQILSQTLFKENLHYGSLISSQSTCDLKNTDT